MEWLVLAQDRGHWIVLMKNIMNLWVLKVIWKFPMIYQSEDERFSWHSGHGNFSSPNTFYLNMSTAHAYDSPVLRPAKTALCSYTPGHSRPLSYWFALVLWRGLWELMGWLSKFLLCLWNLVFSQIMSFIAALSILVWSTVIIEMTWQVGFQWNTQHYITRDIS